jgi:quercetin dioxygenase-like cupin family protein
MKGNVHAAVLKEVEAKKVTEPGADGVAIRVLIDESIGAPTFAMRHFEVAPEGFTPFHSHPWEHEVYVLSGNGKVRHKGGDTTMKEGVFVYVAPGEEHNFVNTGTVPLVFLCMIPVARLRGQQG